MAHLVYQQLTAYIHTLHPQQPPLTLTHLTQAIHTLEQILDHSTKQTIINHLDPLLSIFMDMFNCKEFSLEQYADMYNMIMRIFLKYPKQARKSQPYMEYIITSTIRCLAKISVEISEEWANPTQEEVESDFSQNYELKLTQEIIDQFNQVAITIGFQYMRSYFNPLFRKFMEINDDWRYKYAALLGASQLNESLQNIEELNVYIEWAVISLKHSEAKVKYAAIEMIGQFSHAFNPQFQQRYFQIITPALIQQLNTPIPRIKAHIFASLSNFLTHFQEFWKIENCLTTFIHPLVQNFKNGSPYLQHCCLQTLGSLAEIKNCLGSHLPYIFQVGGFMINEYAQSGVNKSLLSQLFEVMSILFSSQQKKYVQRYVSNFVNLLIGMRQLIEEESFLISWRNICSEHNNFTDITHTIEFLIKLVEKSISDSDCGEVKAVQAIECLQLTFNSFKGHMQPHYQAIETILKQTIQNEQIYLTIRESTIQCLNELVLSVIPEQCNSSDQYWTGVAFNFIQYCFVLIDRVLQNKQDMNLLATLLPAVNKMIGPVGHGFQKIDIINLCQKIIDYKKKIEVIHVQNREEVVSQVETQVQDNLEQDEINSEDQAYEDLVEDLMEENLQDIILEIAQIFASVLKINNLEYNQIVIEALILEISINLQKDETWKYFALNLAATLIQHTSYQEIEPYWAHLMAQFSNSIHSSSNQIKHISAFAIGIIFEKTPVEFIVQQNVVEWLQMLWSVMSGSFQREKDDKELILSLKDNLISALGKLLKNCSVKFGHILNHEIYKRWLSYLPLTNDCVESNCQQTLLLDLLSSSPERAITDLNDLQTICVIFAKFTIKRFKENSSKELVRTRDVFKGMCEWEMFKASSDFLIRTLSGSQQMALSKLLDYE